MKLFSSIKTKFNASRELGGEVSGNLYKVKVGVESEALDDDGYILNPGILQSLVDAQFHGKHLNDRMKPEPTTANIALDLFELLSRVIFKAGQSEDVKITYVEVREGDHLTRISPQ